MKKYRLFVLVLVVSIMTTLLLPFQSLALEPPEFHGKNAILVDAKSFIGLFTLDFSKPVNVVTESPYVIHQLTCRKA